MNYILDTNAISDYIKQFEPTTQRIKGAIRDGHTLYLCEPVRYEVMRGLLAVNATRQQTIFEQQFAPLLTPLTLTRMDWLQAAVFWATAHTAGRQLADVDLLIAALAYRLNAIIISNDEDFAILSVKRENWRES